MDVDMNQEHSDSSGNSIFRLGSLLNELETAHNCIEERIRQLEEVTSRARRRQRWRRNRAIPQTLSNPVLSSVNINNDEILLSNGVGLVIDGTDDAMGLATQDMTLGSRKHIKRNNAHLIAKALEADRCVKKAKIDKGHFFDCNICLEIAREPVLTSCGHLFCWPCIYQLSYIDSYVKECPVCMGEVRDATIVPIYGNGGETKTHNTRHIDPALKIPPRPQAKRIEGWRQKVNSQRSISSMFDRNVRLYNRIVEMEERSRSENRDGVPSAAANQPIASQTSPVMQAEDNPHNLSSQVSRLTLQGSDAFSSLSSAVNSAMDSVERLVDNLEESIARRRMRSNHQPSSIVDSSTAAAAQRNNQIVENNEAHMNSTMAHPSSSLNTYGSATVMQLENHRMRNAVESRNTSFSLSSRRRFEHSRIREALNSLENDSTMVHSFSTPSRRTESAELPGDEMQAMDFTMLRETEG